MESKLFIKVKLILLLCLTTKAILGQINLNMPVNRSVFQRVNNKASIQIGGTISTNYTELQAKLEVINGGTAIEWITLKTNLSPGIFRMELPNVDAGWYTLKVRGLQNGLEFGSIAEISKVGVGEVFIIAGQSNAQGGRPPDAAFPSTTFYGANDDRVNCINYFENSASNEFPFPIISKIAAETDIAPRGRASWCYALLGDLIAQNWNVPVLFFNAATGDTNAQNWSDSAEGIPYYYYDRYIEDGTPYIYLKKTLEYYGKIYGVRSVLWHQGESDIFQFDEYPEKPINYVNNITKIINKSRENIGGNISWLIARVSRMADWTSIGLIQTQYNIGSTPNFNTFVGPETDNIQPGSIYRDGGVHFRAEGFIELANAWYNSLISSNLLYNSNPLKGSNNLEVINSKFVIGPNIPPCVSAIESVTSGDWNNPAIWSCGIVPEITHEVIINEGHTVSINNYTASAKSLTNNGTLIFSNGGILALGQ